MANQGKLGVHRHTKPPSTSTEAYIDADLRECEERGIPLHHRKCCDLITKPVNVRPPQVGINSLTHAFTQTQDR